MRKEMLRWHFGDLIVQETLQKVQVGGLREYVDPSFEKLHLSSLSWDAHNFGNGNGTR